MAKSEQKGQANIAVTRTELVWPGKYDEQGRLRPMERTALPFQVVETINQSRATREQTPLLADLPAPPLFEGQTGPDTFWKNKLIWGDNRYVMASLLQGDPSIGLEPLAGKIDLIYIDPPFATGQDFSTGRGWATKSGLKRPPSSRRRPTETPGAGASTPTSR